jgi:hypothetical protein
VLKGKNRLDSTFHVGISNTEKASSSDISDEGDERLSLSHAVDKKEISTGILLVSQSRRFADRREEKKPYSINILVY